MRLLLITIGLMMLLAGVVLLVVGRRRRGDQRLRCRGCGYELGGILDGVKLLADACPECGAALHVLGATVRGWGRSRPLTLLGVACLVLFAASCGGWLVTGNPGWNARKPVWWLQGEAVFGTGVLAEEAARELVSRVNAKKTLPGAIGPLLPKALREFAPVATSAGGTIPPPVWNEIVGLKYSTPGVDPPGELRQAIAENFVLTRETGSTWRRLMTHSVGGDVTGVIQPLNTEPATEAGFDVVSVQLLVRAEVDGQPWEIEPKDRGTLTTRGPTGNLSAHGIMYPTDWPMTRGGVLAYRKFEPGEHVVRLHWNIPIWIGSTHAAQAHNRGGMPTTPPDSVRDVTTTFTIRIGQKPGDLIRLMDRSTSPGKEPIYTWEDKNMYGVVSDAWVILDSKMRADGVARMQIQGQLHRIDSGHGNGGLYAQREMSGVAGRVLLSVDGDQYRLTSRYSGGESTISCGPHRSNAWVQASVLDLPRVASVDVVIEPDPALAVERGLDSVWNETIVIKDVPLDWSAVDESDESDEKISD